MKRFEYKTAMVLLFSSLCLFISGPAGLLSVALAQEEAESIPGRNLNTSRCEPMTSNVTLPSAKEDVLPPNLYMIYGDRPYQGELSQSKYREGETFGNLDILPENISSDLPAEAVEIIKDTCAQFVVGRAAHLASREEEALDLFRRAERLANSESSRREMRWDQLLCMTDLELPEASALLDELAGEVESSSIREVVRAETCRLLWQIRFGSVDLSRADRAAQLVPMVNDPLVETAFQSIYASGLVLAARYREALEVAQAFQSTSRKYRLDFALPYALYVAGSAEAGVRNWCRAETLFREALDQARSRSNRHAEEGCLSVHVRMLAQQGKCEAAVDLSRHVAPTTSEVQPMQMVRAELLGSRALALAAIGRVDEAERTIESARGLSRAVETVVLPVAVDAVVGLKSHAPDAIERVQKLSEVAFETGGIDLLVTAYRSVPELLAVLVQKSRPQGRFVDLLRRVGDADLVDAVGCSITGDSRGVAALTARQRDVFALLRQGLTNREIAKTLVIAESTAKLHVQRVFDKTGLHSRKAIAVQAALERSSQATSAIDETGVGSDS